MARGQFFAVDPDQFEAAANLGMNAGLAFLVIACGTGKDNRTSAWSAEAVRRYTGIAWNRANLAIDALKKADIVAATMSKTRPRYKLPAPDHSRLIWMPNQLVTSAAGEECPLVRIRRTHELDVLRVLVRMYAVHDLQNEGGIPRRLLWGSYTRERIVEHGAHVLYGLDYETDTVRDSPILAGIQREQWWPTLRLLGSTSLMQGIPWLFDGDHDEAEPIHPLGGDPAADRIVESLGRYLEWADEIFPSVANAREDFEWIIPIPNSYPKATIIRVFRLRYWPHAAYSLAGMATTTESSLRAAFEYESLIEGGSRYAGVKH